MEIEQPVNRLLDAYWEIYGRIRDDLNIVAPQSRKECLRRTVARAINRKNDLIRVLIYQIMDLIETPVEVALPWQMFLTEAEVDAEMDGLFDQTVCVL
jgi:hypothetical protein